MKNVEGKVVVITGASSGIGLATAKVLADNGAKVVLGARRKERLEEIVKEIGEDKAAYSVTDVSKPEDVNKLVKTALDKFGKVDVFFANAGIMPGSNVSELRTEDWNNLVDINCKGVLNSVAAVYPEFKKNNSGHFIVTSSIAGIRSTPGNAVYSATKHFVRVFIDSWRSEATAEAPNLRTTTIFPGAIKTELLNTVPESEKKHLVEKFYENTAISPDAVANSVLYAISQPDNVDVSDIVVRPTREN